MELALRLWNGRLCSATTLVSGLLQSSRVTLYLGPVPVENDARRLGFVQTKSVRLVSARVVSARLVRAIGAVNEWREAADAVAGRRCSIAAVVEAQAGAFGFWTPPALRSLATQPVGVGGES